MKFKNVSRKDGWAMAVNIKNLKYNNQCFERGIVSIYDDKEVTICEMFIDDDGDIGFQYKGEEIYLSQIQFLGGTFNDIR